MDYFFFCLSGCAIVAAVPDNFVFPEEIRNIESLSKVKRIALLDVPPPSNIILGDYFSDSATFWFGTVGMLTIEDTEGNKIVSVNFVSETTRSELRKWLEQADIDVVLIQAERKNNLKMLESYEQFSQVDVDAILELTPVWVGFRFKFGKRELRKSKQEVSPEILYKYRLVSAKSGEVLIQSNVFYSSFDYSENWYDYSELRWLVGNKIRGPSWHIFENQEAVKNNHEKAIKRLSHAIKEVTKIVSVMVTD